MSKKFFSLIYGDKIHTAPKKRVIEAEAFSKLLDAKEVLELAKEDAEKYRIQVAEEGEELKKQATREGFEAGFKSWGEEIARVEQMLVEIRKEMEKKLSSVALTAAKKIVGRELELSENAIFDIVSSSLKAVTQHKKITIYVNKEDLESLEKNRKKIKDLFEHLELLSIRERNDISPGGCIIETEGGIINAQIENKWNVLESALQHLLTPKE